jgi:probable rRNA maturation factor
MIYIQMSSDGDAPESAPATPDESVFERAALAALQTADAPDDVDLTIVLADDAQLHALNRQFLGYDAPTDVLSFPQGETDPDSGRLYLGDIIISLERAAAQAAAGGHPVEAELQLLVVHGVLHLLGHDHAGPAEKDAMWALQAQTLAQLGLNLQP